MKGETQEDPPSVLTGRNKKGLRVGVGIAVLVGLLAGAAYVGGRLLNGDGLAGLPLGGLRSRGLEVLPARELPQTPADVYGIFDHRKDKSIFVGTGNITGSKGQDASGNVHVSLSHDGPVVEVVVTAQTILYKDTTTGQFNGRPPHQGQIQQVLVPGKLDELGVTSIITVWGRKTGDRYLADVLVYVPPVVIRK